MIISSLYKQSREYLYHVKYLREQYTEYDKYELHKVIRISTSKLLKFEDIDWCLDKLSTRTQSKDTTLIAKRA